MSHRLTSSEPVATFTALYVVGAHKREGATSSVREAQTLEEVRRACEAGFPLWVQLFERSEENEAILTDVLKIHPLVIEDTWNDVQIPKLEDFEDFVQIIVHRIHEDSALGEVRFDEVDLLLGKRFVVTRAHSPAVTAPIEAELRRAPRLLAKGPAWLAHAVLDRIVDEYLPYVDRYEQAIEEIERDLEAASRARRPSGFSQRIFALTRALQRFRRFALQQQEILGRLSRGGLAELPREVRPFYGDVYDHFARVTLLAESSREVLSGLLDVYWSMQSSHMNEIMKTLTLISTIMLPLTFIAGVYGMNFENMPELHWRFGYPLALAFMFVVALAIVMYFRSRKWL